MNPFARWEGESFADAWLGGALYLLIMSLLYVGIPVFVLAAFVKLVVIVYQALPF